MLNAALELNNVAHRYGDLEAVRGVSLQLKPESVTCLLGPSGCGKTTILRLIAGLEDLQTGNILISNQTVVDSKGRSLPPEARGIGIVFQDYALFPHLNVRDNIAFGLPAGHDRANKINAALIAVDMQNYVEAFPHMLSGGQQQRLCIARAIAAAPEVLLLDEPCSALDPIATSKIEDLIDELRGEFTVLIVTHNMQQAARASDYTAMMMIDDQRAGGVIEFDDTKNIFTRPKDKRTEDYVTGRFG